MADVTNLAQVTEGGISCATFPDIKDALARKMQEIYGYDIDLSTASADGQYVMMEALVLNNIYRTLESLVNNLSLANASGKYLDILSNLSGVFRRQATNSTASVYIKNTSGVNLSPSNLMFLDKNGFVWKWTNQKNTDGQNLTTFTKGEIYLINVVCEDVGSINAVGGNLIGTVVDNVTLDLNKIFEDAALRQSGDIYNCFSETGILTYQDQNAKIGQSLESDSSLRNRRFLFSNIGAKNSLESIYAQLLSIEGVKDCYIYNATDSNAPTKFMDTPTGDECGPKANSIYPIIYLEEGISIPDQTIGEVLYNNLSPGIRCQTIFSPTHTGNAPYGGELHKYDVPQNIPTTPATDAKYVTYVQWKQAKSSNPKIEFGLEINENSGVPNTTSALSDDLQNKIIDSVISYLNNLKINEPIVQQDLVNIIMNCYQGRIPLYKVIGLYESTEEDLTGATGNPFLFYSYFANGYQYKSPHPSLFFRDVYTTISRFYYDKSKIGEYSFEFNEWNISSSEKKFCYKVTVGSGALYPELKSTTA